MLTLKKSMDVFFDHLKSSDYAESTLKSYHFAICKALPHWLFASSLCFAMKQYPVTSFTPPSYLKSKIPKLKRFIDWAVSNRAKVSIEDALSEYEAILLQDDHSQSWIKQWKSLAFSYGEAMVLSSDLEIFRFLLMRIVSEDIVISSKQATNNIVRFVKFLHTHGLQKTDLPWEYSESWRQQIKRTLKDSVNVFASPSSSGEELLLAYLNFCHQEKELTLKSLNHEKRYLAYFLNWAEPFNVNGFNAPLIKKFISHLKEKRLSWTSIRHYFNTLKGFSEFLVECSILQKKPTCEIRLKANERSPKDTLSLEERNTLLSISARLLKDKGLLPEDKSALSFFLVRDACILHLFATTGIRLSEITSLKCSNVHLEDRTLTIRGKGSRSYLEKNRIVFLNDPQTFKWLVYYLDIRRDMTCPWLFVTIDGFKLLSPGIQTIVRKYGKMAGIKRSVSPNLLRASFASWMIEKGIDPVALKKLMGHESIRTTFGYYVSLKEEHVKNTWARCNPLSGILSQDGRSTDNE